MEDSAIVTLYWQRSEQAIAESDTKYGPYCGHIAYGLLQNSEDTQECVSDTWLAAWNAMPPHRPAEELGDCVPLGGDAQQALEGRELTRLLNRFLSGLPAAQRQVFLARYWYGAAVKDIARQFGYSESKVKSMLYRTREKLRLTLEKEGY